jgi:redox-sensitive bicupin YhaK (pirin superfamily)
VKYLTPSARRAERAGGDGAGTGYWYLTVNGEQLAAGDGAAIAYEDNVAIRAAADSELLLFDMA